LLDLLCAHARPGRDCYGGFDRSVGVFALRHALITVEAPDADADQHDPGNVALLDEKPRDVALAFNHLVVGMTMGQVGLIVGHSFSRRFLEQPTQFSARFS
jgi:hypothetical protein